MVHTHAHTIVETCSEMEKAMMEEGLEGRKTENMRTEMGKKD